MACYDEGLVVADDESLRRSLRRQRAILLSRTGRAAESIDDLVDEVATTVTEDEPDSAVARHALAVAYLNADQPLDAADVAEEALAHLTDEDDPRIEIIRHVLAQAFRALHQPDNALEQLALVAESGRRRDSDALVAEMNEQMGDLLDGLDRDAEAAAKYATAAVAYVASELPLEATRSRRRTAMSLMWAGKMTRRLTPSPKPTWPPIVLDLSDPRSGGSGRCWPARAPGSWRNMATSTAALIRFSVGAPTQAHPISVTVERRGSAAGGAWLTCWIGAERGPERP